MYQRTHRAGTVWPRTAVVLLSTASLATAIWLGCGIAQESEPSQKQSFHQLMNQAMTVMDQGGGTENLSSLGASVQAVHLTLGVPGSAKELTTVAVNNQGLVDLLEAAVTGLEPRSEYVLALAANPDGSGALEPIAQFKTNPSGAAIVATIGPLRRVV